MAMLQEGEKFATFKDLDDRLDRFQKENYVQLSKRSSRSIQAAKARAPRKTIKDDLKYSEVEYACIHGGSGGKVTPTGRIFISRSKGIRPNQQTYQTGCEFRVRLRASSDGQSLEVTHVNSEHNHELSKESFMRLPKQRRLSAVDAASARNYLDMKADKKRVQEQIFQETGKKVTLKDLHNLAARKRSEVDLKAAVETLQRSEGIVEVVKKDGVVQGAYFQRREWKEMHSLYPEVVLVDATCKVNDLGLPLYLLYAVDGNGVVEIVAAWFVMADDKATTRRLVKIFKEHNDTSKTQCVMVDKDWTEREVIREEIQGAHLQICPFHAVRAFRREIMSYNVSKTELAQAVEVMERLTHAQSAEEYGSRYAELLQIGNGKLTEHFNKQWHSVRDKWVEGLKHSVCQLMDKADNRLESTGQKVKSAMGSRLVLTDGIQSLLACFQSLIQERGHRVAVMLEKVPVGSHSSNPLKDFAFQLTPFAYRLVAAQHRASLGVVIPARCGVEAKLARCGGSIVVKANDCSCPFTGALKLPCKHTFALRAHLTLPVFDLGLCHVRWKKDYNAEGYRLLGEGAAMEDERPVHVLSQSERYWRALQVAKKMAAKVSELPAAQFQPALDMLARVTRAWEEGRYVVVETYHPQDIAVSRSAAATTSCSNKVTDHDDGEHVTRHDDIKASSYDDVEASSHDDIKASRHDDIKASSYDIEATRHDIEASSHDDIEASSHDIKASSYDIEASRHDDIEATRDNDIEATRVNDIEATRDNDIEATRDNDIEATRHDDIEATRHDDIEASSHDDIEASSHDDIEATRHDIKTSSYDIEASSHDDIEASSLDELYSAGAAVMETESTSHDEPSQAVKTIIEFVM